MTDAEKQAIWEWCGFTRWQNGEYWQSPPNENGVCIVFTGLREPTLNDLFEWAMLKIQELPGYRLFTVEHTGTDILDTSLLRWLVSIHFEAGHGETIYTAAETLVDAFTQAVLRLKEKGGNSMAEDRLLTKEERDEVEVLRRVGEWFATHTATHKRNIAIRRMERGEWPEEVKE